MKKLIGILAVLLMTTTVFGQKFIRNLSFIEGVDEPFIEFESGRLRTVEDHIRYSFTTITNYEWIDYIHFVQNDRLFLLSYEPKEDYLFGGDRDIYLYSRDITDINSPWEKASDVVMTNNWEDPKNYNDVDFFIYNENRHNNSVGEVVVEDDCVKITIGWEMFHDGSHLNAVKTIIFIPDENNPNKFIGHNIKMKPKG